MPHATYSWGETGLAGLADLVGVRVPAGVDRGAGRADRGAEGVGERLDRREVTAGAAATGDDDRGLGQLGPAGRLARLAVGDPGRPGGVGDGDARRPARAARAGGRLGRGRVGLDRDDRGALGDGRRARCSEPAKTDWVVTGPAVAGLDVDGVGDQAGAGLDRQPGGDLLALGEDDDQDRGRRGLPDQLGQHLGLRRDQVVADLGGVDRVDRSRRRTAPAPSRALVEPGADEHRGTARRAGGRWSAARGWSCGRRRRRGRRGRGLRTWLGFRFGRGRRCVRRTSARRGTRRAGRRPSPSSVTIWPRLARAAAAVNDSTLVHAAARPTCVGVDAEVGQRPGLDRLLLGRHDPLERGVARLVDLVGHATTSAGSDGLHGLGRDVAVAADGRRAALDR